MFEIAEAAQLVQDAISEDATFIQGHVKDDRIQGDIQITVIATGFDLKNTEDKPFTNTYPANGIVDPLGGILSGNTTASQAPAQNFGASHLSSDVKAREKAVDMLDLPPFFQK